MNNFIYRVEAVDPWDGDSYEIGNFSSEKVAEYVRRKHEYVTDTGYSKAIIIPVKMNDNNHYLLDDPEDSGYSRIGYFAILDDDGKFIILRDKVAFNDDLFSSYERLMNIIANEFDYSNDLVIETDEDIHLLYTEVPYTELDIQMELEASKKFIKYLSNRRINWERK